MRLFILIAFLFADVNGFSQTVKKIKITELEKIIAESKTPLIVNFWATFCKPCIAEMPAFQKLAEAHKKDGLQLIFVSLDLQDVYPKKVQEFIAKRKITNRVVWLDETNADYFIPKVDSSWSGAIPATIFINNKKGYRKFAEEEFSEEKLAAEIKLML